MFSQEMMKVLMIRPGLYGLGTKSIQFRGKMLYRKLQVLVPPSSSIFYRYGLML